MYSTGTENYNLPQWQPNDKPTFLGDFNEAFRKIDAQMKINNDLARQGGGGSIPQNLIDQVNQNTIDVRALSLQVGNDTITSIGASITNAIVNLKNVIDSMATNISNIASKIGNDTIAGVGTSITNAIKNLSNTLTSQTQILYDLGIKIGSDAIDLIGSSITNAIINLKNAIDSISNKIGNTNLNAPITDVIGNTIDDTLRAQRRSNLAEVIGYDELYGGDSITKTIVNIWAELYTEGAHTLKSTINNILAKIGTDDISSIGTSITNAIVNLFNRELDSKWAVGAIYLSIIKVNPSELFGGVWEEIESGLTFWTTTDEEDGGQKIEAGLPNITGGLSMVGGGSSGGWLASSGAITKRGSSSRKYWQGSSGSDGGISTGFDFKASDSNAIYGKSNTVQPPAIKVYAYKRIS